MRKSLLATAALSLGLFIAGCGAQGGKTIMTQGGNAEPVLGQAPQNGTYKLYTAMSPNPTLTVNLNQGDPLGWQRGPDGRYTAVAGDQTETLSRFSQAYWKLEKNK